MTALAVAIFFGLVVLALLVWREYQHERDRDRLLAMIERMTAFIAEMGATQAGIATRPAIHTERGIDAETRLRREIEEATSRESTQRTIERGAATIKKAYADRSMTISDEDALEQARRMVTGKGLEQ